MSDGLFLQAYLAPLAPWLGREGITDILVNRPGEVWIETSTKGLVCEPAPDLTEVTLGHVGLVLGLEMSRLPHAASSTRYS